MRSCKDLMLLKFRLVDLKFERLFWIKVNFDMKFYSQESVLSELLKNLRYLISLSISIKYA